MHVIGMGSAFSENMKPRKSQNYDFCSLNPVVREFAKCTSLSGLSFRRIKRKTMSFVECKRIQVKCFFGGFCGSTQYIAASHLSKIRHYSHYMCVVSQSAQYTIHVQCERPCFSISLNIRSNERSAHTFPYFTSIETKPNQTKPKERKDERMKEK